MKYLIQLLNYKYHSFHNERHVIIIKNLLNVNIFVQPCHLNFKSAPFFMI